MAETTVAHSFKRTHHCSQHNLHSSPPWFSSMTEIFTHMVHLTLRSNMFYPWFIWLGRHEIGVLNYIFGVCRLLSITFSSHLSSKDSRFSYMLHYSSNEYNGILQILASDDLVSETSRKTTVINTILDSIDLTCLKHFSIPLHPI